MDNLADRLEQAARDMRHAWEQMHFAAVNARQGHLDAAQQCVLQSAEAFDRAAELLAPAIEVDAA